MGSHLRRYCRTIKTVRASCFPISECAVHAMRLVDCNYNAAACELVTIARRHYLILYMHRRI